MKYKYYLKDTSLFFFKLQQYWDVKKKNVLIQPWSLKNYKPYSIVWSMNQMNKTGNTFKKINLSNLV